MKVIIQTIPHSEQDYDTVGNWKWENGSTLFIYVSNMSDWKREMAVAYHELFEALWCAAAGVAEEDVTKFDLQHTDHDVEPGDCKEAPYHEGHVIATKLEKQAFSEWAWAEYDREVVNL